MVRTAVLALVAVGGVVTVFCGHPAGWFGVGAAVLGLGGHLYAQRVRRAGPERGPGLRAYAFVFAAALVAAAVALWVLAISGGPEHRGAYTGLAILWTVLAAGALSIVWGVERRLAPAHREGDVEDRADKG